MTFFKEDIYNTRQFPKDQNLRTFRRGHFLKDILDGYRYSSARVAEKSKDVTETLNKYDLSFLNPSTLQKGFRKPFSVDEVSLSCCHLKKIEHS
jgi:hypothetical protein